MAPPIKTFQDTVLGYYGAHGRDLPWRVAEPDGNFDPYKILVSEMMLQQTQVPRVIPKYQSFLRQFPDVGTLAKAGLSDVLKQWSGLGYNRRAKYLHEAAKQIVSEHSGQIPKTLNTLTNLLGIGHNTAAAICVYAYNQPQVFIETNIRTVYIHHFFQDKSVISDADILPFIETSLRGQDPRNFYWALMDYGTFLKTTEGNLSAKSKHYTKQSKFNGSRRQIRGKVLKALVDGPQDMRKLALLIDDIRLVEVLPELESEGLITHVNTRYTLNT